MRKESKYEKHGKQATNKNNELRKYIRWYFTRRITLDVSCFCDFPERQKVT